MPRSGVEDTISCRPHRERGRPLRADLVALPHTTTDPTSTGNHRRPPALTRPDLAVIAGPHRALLGKISPMGQEAVIALTARDHPARPGATLATTPSH